MTTYSETWVVEYHSREWDELVEQRWVTVWVEGGRAIMLRETRYAPRWPGILAAVALAVVAYATPVEAQWRYTDDSGKAVTKQYKADVPAHLRDSAVFAGQTGAGLPGLSAGEKAKREREALYKRVGELITPETVGGPSSEDIERENRQNFVNSQRNQQQVAPAGTPGTPTLTQQQKAGNPRGGLGMSRAEEDRRFRESTGYLGSIGGYQSTPRDTGGVPSGPQASPATTGGAGGQDYGSKR